MQWRNQHRLIQQQVLKGTPPEADLVLKGGTALMTCYGLNRFSEDLDFDARHQGLNTIKHFSKIVARYGYECNVRKNTSSVQRLLIHYGGHKPLKVETSLRRNHINDHELVIVDGVLTYNIDQLAIMKATAYSARDTLRDLFDVTFIVNTFYERLSEPTQAMLRYALAEKGLEQFDILTAQEHDELIEPDTLASNLLNAFDVLDLSTPTPPQRRSDIAKIITQRAAIRNTQSPTPTQHPRLKR